MANYQISMAFGLTLVLSSFFGLNTKFENNCEDNPEYLSFLMFDLCKFGESPSESAVLAVY